MADKEIYCNRCKCFVGIIRDGKLMVGLVYICPRCIVIDNENDFLNTSNKNYKPKATEDFMNIFGDIFKK